MILQTGPPRAGRSDAVEEHFQKLWGCLSWIKTFNQSCSYRDT